MAKKLISILVLLLSFHFAKAIESQIILVQSEAYLVTLDENYDVLEIIERIPDYFQNHSSHEEILAEQIRNNNNGVYGCHDMLLDKEEPVQYAACNLIVHNDANTYSSELDDIHIGKALGRIDPRYRKT